MVRRVTCRARYFGSGTRTDVIAKCNVRSNEIRKLQRTAAYEQSIGAAHYIVANMSRTAIRPAVARLTAPLPQLRSNFASSASASASTSTSPERAVEYLSTLLRLPSNRQIPAPLALRMLTHRSYRGSHVLGLGSRMRGGNNRNDLEGAAPHNARLAFLGKRAAKGYLAMLIHSRASSQSFGDIEERIENLVHLNNLGREVGSAWNVQDVMRWQSNVVSGSRRFEGQRGSRRTCRRSNLVSAQKTTDQYA